jgi:superfamily II DNA/RNA helicase
MVDSVQLYLNKQGFSSLALHGDMPQPVRKRVMNEFKLTPASILITTDIAARGIDVADIISVINFDLPQNNEYYIHRVGRTGRAGKNGNAYTLLNSPDQVVALKEIEKKTKSKIVQSNIVLDSVSEVTPKKQAPRGKRLNIKSREKRALVFSGTTHNKTKVVVHSDRKIGRKPRTIRHTHKSKIHF